jgi:hypothetical protein
MVYWGMGNYLLQKQEVERQEGSAVSFRPSAVGLDGIAFLKKKIENKN